MKRRLVAAGEANMTPRKRTPEELAALKADRARYQATKPGLADIEAKGGTLLPLREVLALQVIGAAIRDERRRQSLTLEQLAAKVGMDAPALSRIETGRNPNPTMETLSRLASALHKSLSVQLVDSAANERPK
jgi:ribosome-binding protein aMBF1 (putative translation factor)